MDSRRAHAETGRGFDVLAATKYREELAERVALLRSGGHGLLAVEVEELREILPGASVVHLQCSHGLDGLSLLALGAGQVVGVDISQEMIRLAEETTRELGLSAKWYCADVLDLPEELHESADLVYTGKGALPWVMDLDAWAVAVRSVLKPGGSVYIFEGHPLDNLWDRSSAEVRLREDGAGYFNADARENAGFPADAVQRVIGNEAKPVMRERFWRPDQVMAALQNAELRHESYREHPDLFWNQFPAWPTELRARLPHSYSVCYRRADLEASRNVERHAIMIHR